jgi:predicted nucleic acid-binding protein
VRRSGLVLLDSSVWINYLRNAAGEVGDLVEELLVGGKVAIHPFVIGELAMGNLAQRDAFLARLRTLPAVARLPEEAAMRLANTKRLWGRGIGWLDMHLLAAAHAAPGGVSLWTLDVALERAADALGLAWAHAAH